MSVIIKNMTLPNSCLECKFTKERGSSLGLIVDCILGCGTVIAAFSDRHYVNDRYPNCPLLEEDVSIK